MQFLTWFEGIFSSTSDKSRLITVIISALIAISVVLLNQYLTRKREEKKLLIEKVEQFYLATETFSESVVRVADLFESHFNDLNRPSEGEEDNPKITEIKGVFLEVRKNYFDIRMLCNLYFPTIEFEDRYHLRMWKAYNHLMLSIYANDEKSFYELDESINHLLEPMFHFIEISQKLIKK